MQQTTKEGSIKELRNKKVCDIQKIAEFTSFLSEITLTISELTHQLKRGWKKWAKNTIYLQPIRVTLEPKEQIS